MTAVKPSLIPRDAAISPAILISPAPAIPSTKSGNPSTHTRAILAANPTAAARIHMNPAPIPGPVPIQAPVPIPAIPAKPASPAPGPVPYTCSKQIHKSSTTAPYPTYQLGIRCVLTSETAQKASAVSNIKSDNKRFHPPFPWFYPVPLFTTCQLRSFNWRFLPDPGN